MTRTGEPEQIPGRLNAHWIVENLASEAAQGSSA